MLEGHSTSPRAVATKALVRMKPRRKTVVVRWSLNMCLPAFFMLTAPTLHRLRILLNVATASLEAATRGLEEAKTEVEAQAPESAVIIRARRKPAEVDFPGLP
jgi:hypothetical protein